MSSITSMREVRCLVSLTSSGDWNKQQFAKMSSLAVPSYGVPLDKCMINNQYVSPSTGQFVDVFNPANEQVIASVYARVGFEWGTWRSLIGITGSDMSLLRRPNAGPADVDAAVTAARACFESEAWQAATGKDRYVCAFCLSFCQCVWSPRTCVT